MRGRLDRRLALVAVAGALLAACADDDGGVIEEGTEAAVPDERTEPGTDDELVEDDDDDVTVAIAEPEDGATVNSPFTVRFTAEGVEIEESGEAREGAGHFHLMIDTDCVPEGEVIPEDDDHLHFGDASTETTLELGPGTHELCLQLGDGEHVALDETDVITVTVEE